MNNKAIIGTVLMTCALVTGCAVNVNDMKHAERLCKDNGGIQWLYAFPGKEVHCKNGLVAQGWKGETE